MVLHEKIVVNSLLGGHLVMAATYSKFPINNDPKIYFDIVQIIPSANLLQIKFYIRQKIK